MTESRSAEGAGEEGSTPREGRLSEHHHANGCVDHHANGCVDHHANGCVHHHANGCVDHHDNGHCHHHHHDLVIKGLPMVGGEGSTLREGHVSEDHRANGHPHHHHHDLVMLLHT